jgi:hypothetical protein
MAIRRTPRLPGDSSIRGSREPALRVPFLLHKWERARAASAKSEISANPQVGDSPPLVGETGNAGLARRAALVNNYAIGIAVARAMTVMIAPKTAIRGFSA